MFVSLLAAAVLAFPGPPPPDPDPSACYKGWCPATTWVAYDIELPAVNAATGKVIPGLFFTCHVPVRWKGKLNKQSHMTCKIKP